MKSFLIPSLLLAGFSNPSDDQLDKKDNASQSKEPNYNFWNLMDRKLPITLAGHSSHRSHGSHSSHRSSSTSRVTPTPSPSPSPAPKVYVAPKKNNNSTTPESVLPKISGNSAQFKRIAMRVQMYLYAFGFYNGAIDGLVDIDTQAAIVKFQDKNGLTITGKVDNELLKAMNVSTE
jgi:His-Xaa-Ser repeat protein HxsA